MTSRVGTETPVMAESELQETMAAAAKAVFEMQECMRPTFEADGKALLAWQEQMRPSLEAVARAA